MNAHALEDTVQGLIADHKGLLAIDESNQTSDYRFMAFGIPQTEDARRSYREMIIATANLGDGIGGEILHDEAIRQKACSGTPFLSQLSKDGIPGIKVDTGARHMAGHPGETIAEGLHGLRDRLSEYAQMGARLAKWRAVFDLDDVCPSAGCIAGVSADTLPRHSVECEPVWAIGSTGHHASSQQVQEMRAVIRHRCSRMFGEKSAQTPPIHYGGSVEPDIAAAFPSPQDGDAAPLGGAGLDADQFIADIHAGMSGSHIEGSSKWPQSLIPPLEQDNCYQAAEVSQPTEANAWQ